MLHQLLVQNLDELVARAKAAARRWTPASTPALESNVALLLTPLLARLGDAPRVTSTGPVADGAIGAAAARHVRVLLEQGWPVSQVVRDYGDLRQAIVELAAAKGTAVGLEELGALGCCLDGAIAEAVVEYARLRDEATSHREVERLRQVGHDLRTQLQTALLSFRALKTGTADVCGRAGDTLGRSLAHLGDVIATGLPAVRLAATSRVSLAALVHEVAVAAHGEAEQREIRLTIQPGDPALAVDVDRELLASALIHLLQNAFRYTPEHGCVTLRTRRESGCAVVEVEDECGGLASGKVGSRHVPGDRRASARSAPGGGLATSRRAVQANGGEVHAHNLPGKGCIFGIQLPVAAPPGAQA